MNITEAATLLRKVVAYCPSQTIDEFTPEAWAESLRSVRLDDALEAVRIIGSRPLEPGKVRYIEVGHIAWEVGKMRAKRIESAPPIDPPGELDSQQYLAWLRHTREAVASGLPILADRRELVSRPVDLRGITKTIEEIDQ